MAVLSKDEARRARARRGQARAVASRPLCRACGKKNMSASERFDEVGFVGSLRRCYSCGHEQGTINGERVGFL